MISHLCHTYSVQHILWNINLPAELFYSPVVMYSECHMVACHGHSCWHFRGWSVPHKLWTWFMGRAFHSPCLQTAHHLYFLYESFVNSLYCLLNPTAPWQCPFCCSFPGSSGFCSILIYQLGLLHWEDLQWESGSEENCVESRKSLNVKETVAFSSPAPPPPGQRRFR